MSRLALLIVSLIGGGAVVATIFAIDKALDRAIDAIFDWSDPPSLL